MKGPSRQMGIFVAHFSLVGSGSKVLSSRFLSTFVTGTALSICHQLGANGPWCFQGDLNKALACDICKAAELMCDGTRVFFVLATWLCLWCSLDFEGFLYWTKQSVTLTMPLFVGLLASLVSDSTLCEQLKMGNQRSVTSCRP